MTCATVQLRLKSGLLRTNQIREFWYSCDYNNNNHNNHNKFSTYIAHSKTCPNGFYNKEKILKRRSVLNSRSSSGLFITKDVVVRCMWRKILVPIFRDGWPSWKELKSSGKQVMPLTSSLQPSLVISPAYLVNSPDLRVATLLNSW